MSKPMCGTDDCRKAIAKAESLVRKAIAYKEKHGYRENLGYESDHVLDDFMETLDLTYNEKCCIRNYFYNLCGKI